MKTKAVISRKRPPLPANTGRKPSPPPAEACSEWNYCDGYANLRTRELQWDRPHQRRSA